MSSGCKKEEPQTITRIELNKTNLEISIGENYLLAVQHYPENMDAPQYKWSIENDSCAVIDTKGRIYSRSIGKTTVKVQTADGRLSSSCVVEVKPILVSSIKLNKKDVELIVGEQEVLSYEIMPINTTDRSINWTSSNDKIATIEKGVIKAISAGSVMIKIACGNVSDSCAVKIRTIDVTSISLDINNVTLEEFGSAFITAAIYGGQNE